MPRQETSSKRTSRRCRGRPPWDYRQDGRWPGTVHSDARSAGRRKGRLSRRPIQYGLRKAVSPSRTPRWSSGDSKSNPTRVTPGLRVPPGTRRSARGRPGSHSPSSWANTGAGSCGLVLPPDASIDLEVAERKIHEAESAVHVEDWSRGVAAATIAWGISNRRFLPGEDAPWIVERRRWLEDVRLRALRG